MILEEIEGPMGRKPRANTLSDHMLCDISFSEGPSTVDPLFQGSNDIKSLGRSLINERTLFDSVSLTQRRSLSDMVKEVEQESDLIMDDLKEIRSPGSNKKRY